MFILVESCSYQSCVSVADVFYTVELCYVFYGRRGNVFYYVAAIPFQTSNLKRRKSGFFIEQTAIERCETINGNQIPEEMKTAKPRDKNSTSGYT